MSSDQLQQCIRQYKDLKCFLKIPSGRIELSGGEPFLSPELTSFLAFLKQEGIPRRVFSNGSLLTAKTISGLKRHGLTHIQISIDGDRETHNVIRGSDSFQGATASLKLLVKSDVDVTISTTLNRLNRHCIRYICNLGARNGCRVFFSRMIPAGRGKKIISDTLNRSDWLLAMQDIFQQRKSRRLIAYRDPTWMRFFMPDGLINQSNSVTGCAAGYHGLAVDADGTVYPCQRLPVSIGNIFIDDLTALWSHPIMEALRDRDALKGTCGTCRYRWLCGGCRGAAYAATQDYLGEDPQCPWG